MPSKQDCIEDVLAQIEEEFYRVTAARESFENYFGGRVRISYSTRKPKLNIEIKEQKTPGPKLGSKFRIDASKRAARRFAKSNPEIEIENEF